MEPTDSSAPSLTLNPTERRVLGVLVEKGLTTPEYYPLSLNALVAGCNQKNNRDPLTSYDAAQVEHAAKSLESKGLALSVIGDTGRVARWRQELPRKLGLDAVELAIVGELLLRGAQSEGDLRGRASRMRPIETLEALREKLQRLRVANETRPPLVARLSAEGAARGVRWTHSLYLESEQRALLESEGEAAASAPASTRSAEPAPRAAAAEPGGNALLARIAALEERIAQVERRLDDAVGPPAS
jgi:uncharacterized protein YceH (UPF0502 family)